MPERRTRSIRTPLAPRRVGLAGRSRPISSAASSPRKRRRVSGAPARTRCASRCSTPCWRRFARESPTPSWTCCRRGDRDWALVWLLEAVPRVAGRGDRYLADRAAQRCSGHGPGGARRSNRRVDGDDRDLGDGCRGGRSGPVRRARPSCARRPDAPGGGDGIAADGWLAWSWLLSTARGAHWREPAGREASRLSGRRSTPGDPHRHGLGHCCDVRVAVLRLRRPWAWGRVARQRLLACPIGSSGRTHAAAAGDRRVGRAARRRGDRGRDHRLSPRSSRPSRSRARPG